MALSGSFVCHNNANDFRKWCIFFVRYCLLNTIFLHLIDEKTKIGFFILASSRFQQRGFRSIYRTSLVMKREAPVAFYKKCALLSDEWKKVGAYIHSNECHVLAQCLNRVPSATGGVISSWTRGVSFCRVAFKTFWLRSQMFWEKQIKHSCCNCRQLSQQQNNCNDDEYKIYRVCRSSFRLDGQRKFCLLLKSYLIKFISSWLNSAVVSDVPSYGNIHLFLFFSATKCAGRLHMICLIGMLR